MAQGDPRQIAAFGRYFKEHLADYSIIGGAATLLHLEARAEGRHSKATKDLDIAVLDLTPQGNRSGFLARFREYVEEMRYEAFVGHAGKVCAYRFVDPKNRSAPDKLEIATRQLDGLKLRGSAQRLTAFDISAIACDPIYIEHLKRHSEPMVLPGEGGTPVSVARVGSLILMKALAYLNLIDLPGMKEHAHRHASDIVRLSGILRESDRIEVGGELYGPLEKLFAVKDRAFLPDRVVDLRGFGINAERVIEDIQRFIRLIPADPASG